MAVIYANEIIKRAQNELNPFTIDNVPNYWKDACLANLLSRGYDGYGNKL